MNYIKTEVNWGSEEMNYIKTELTEYPKKWIILKQN